MEFDQHDVIKALDFERLGGSAGERRAVDIVREGSSGIHFIHTADDHAENVSPAGLEDTYRAAKVFLNRVLSAEIYPVKKEIDSTLRDRIEKYLWQSLGKRPELNWTESYKR